MFFHHLPTSRRKSLDFCWANFGMDFKTAFFLAKRATWGRKFYIPKKIPIIVTQWEKKFIYLEEIFGMAAKIRLYVSVQSFWEKHTLSKFYIGLMFFGPFGEQVSTPCQKFLGRVIKNFSCFYLISDIGQKFLLLAKFLRQFIQNCILVSVGDNFKQSFWLEKLNLFHHLPTLSWKFSGFCRTFFCELSKSAILMAKSTTWGKSFLSRNIFWSMPHA